MPILIDTDVAIHLRDGSDEIADRVATLGEQLCFSIITRVELENGVYRDPIWSQTRRAALDLILRDSHTFDFDDAALAAYRRMVESAGFSKPRINDRMIAATAIANGLKLVTINGSDYRDLSELQLEVWPAP